ncbi:PP2C family protein-serine/threonine phosphatase [Rothia aerolata]|uniref:Serine/threonine protein phosphatase n=1 Tax=Rothia aerolata TaxID=1812262 RepID=A0A917ITK5_9MICC|nr:protein phosphatase 2C domain-containing protein [Rothia aerolata]GGH63222.1 serine/threonine protein phosphatase [Rothia aerolata]
MSTHLTTLAGSATDVGAYRDNNEDSYSVAGTLSVVADGMGGHEAGEVASRLCARTLAYSQMFSRPGGMTEEEEAAYQREVAAEGEASNDSAEARGLLRRRRKNTSALNRQIMRTLEKLRDVIGEADEKIKDMLGQRAGTTVTGAWLTNIGDQYMWFIFNVGDSRTYRLVREEDVETDSTDISLSAGAIEGLHLEQVTVDHSEVQYLVDTGQITALEALTHPRRNVITRALGTGNYWEPDFWVIPAHEGDRLMMCSDGLSGELSHNYMARVLATVEHPQDAADVLQMAALRAGGRDNITVVVVDAITEETAQRNAEQLRALTETQQQNIVSRAEDFETKHTATVEQESYNDERRLKRGSIEAQ